MTAEMSIKMYHFDFYHTFRKERDATSQPFDLFGLIFYNNILCKISFPKFIFFFNLLN